MVRVFLLSAADAVAAVYLLAWVLRRERRDRGAVLAVGVTLALCAVALLVIGWPRAEPVRPVPPAAPVQPVGPATQV